MARYQPENYPAAGGPPADERTIVGLIRSGLLKRFESSVYAFAETCGRMIEDHARFLEALDRGWVIRRELADELAAINDDDAIDELLASSDDAEDAANYDVETLREAVESDQAILLELHEAARAVTCGGDPKLKELADDLAEIVEKADHEGIDEETRRQKRKTLIFSYFGDTVDWIENYLKERLRTDDRLACFRGRIASVVGDESRGGISRDDAVYGFAPESSEAPAGHDEDLFDVLISTDVLAEGMNLQQCRNILNFDLPWNPMRLVQRHGRIDRIGSPHDAVFLRTFFPDNQLNRLLRLEGRVRRKLAKAAASVGVETAPIEGGAESDVSFSETRDEIERLFEEDTSIYERGGTASAAQTGEEYRQQLREASNTPLGDEVKNLPWKAGSGMVKGNRRGHFFCARVGKRIYLRFVPWDGNGEIVSEIGTCLRLIECESETPRVMPDDLRRMAHSAWDRARQHIFEKWTFETDPANLQPKVSKFNRELAEFLREHPPADTEQAALDKILDAVEAPCPRREERLLREIFEAEYASDAERAAAVVAEVERIGLEPYHPPKELPPITPDQIHLVCWMAIEV